MSTNTPSTPLLPTDNRTIADVSQGIASLVWWSFDGTRISPTDLRDKVARAGMDPAKVPDIDPLAGLAQAVREFSVREGRRKIREAVVTHQDSSNVVINVLEYRKDSNRRSSKVTVDTLVWDIASSTWMEEGTTEDSAKLRDRVADRQAFYDGNAVRDFLVMPSLAKSKCFTLRRGVYVVPHLTAGPLADVQNVLQDLESFNLSVASVAGDDQSRGTMGALAQESVRDELAELQEQIDGWKDMASRVRSDTRERVLSRFQDLRSRCELYTQALQVTMEDLQDEVADLEEVAMEVISLRDEEADAKHPTQAKVVDPSQARREALSAMTMDQLGILWSVHCDGTTPDSMEDMVERIATALEAA